MIEIHLQDFLNDDYRKIDAEYLFKEVHNYVIEEKSKINLKEKKKIIIYLPKGVSDWHMNFISDMYPCSSVFIRRLEFEVQIRCEYKEEPKTERSKLKVFKEYYNEIVIPYVNINFPDHYFSKPNQGLKYRVEDLRF